MRMLEFMARLFAGFGCSLGAGVGDGVVLSFASFYVFDVWDRAIVALFWRLMRAKKKIVNVYKLEEPCEDLALLIFVWIKLKFSRHRDSNRGQGV